MLKEFKVKNFKSIRDELYFSMETGENVRATQETKHNTILVNSKTKILKNTLIFGPNASGKSNFLEALFTLNALVVMEIRSVTQKLPYISFGEKNDPTTFDITFIKNGTEYHYYIEYDASKIYKERLLAKNKEVFNRETEDNQNLRDNATLIFEYQAQNNKEAVTAYRWFSEDLIFENSNFQLSDEILFETLKDDKKKQQFLKMLEYVDFNIRDVEVLELPVSSFAIEFANKNFDNDQRREIFLKSQRELTLSLTHSDELSGDFTLILASESKGTRAAIRFILTMLMHDSGKVLLFDEFDASFHLELAQTFLSLINSPYQKNQFILTSHEAALMDYKMRKDQIYFMEKDINGASNLSSLFDFNQSETRNDVSISKKYLAGRFGAIPVINDSAALSILGEHHD